MITIKTTHGTKKVKDIDAFHRFIEDDYMPVSGGNSACSCGMPVFISAKDDEGFEYSYNGRKWKDIKNQISA